MLLLKSNVYLLIPSFLSTDKFCLVLWPEENSVSVLCLERVVQGSEVGDRCRVKVQKKIHEGKILAIGKLNLYYLHIRSHWRVHLSTGLIL